jgi:hypothetical protein
MLEQLRNLYAALTLLLKDPRVRLYLAAKKSIGLKLTNIPEVGCVDALEKLHFNEFKKNISGSTSTITLYKCLQTNKGYAKVNIPLTGDIIVSPTNGRSIGHCGVLIGDGLITSNSSYTGRWSQNYTMDSWNALFCKQKGLGVHYFRKLSV